MFECKDCVDREPGCHSWCESYKREKKRLAKIREARDKDRDIVDYRYTMVANAKAKSAKNKKKRRGIYKFGG